MDYGASRDYEARHQGGDTDTTWKPVTGTDSFLGCSGYAMDVGDRGVLTGLAVSFVRFFPAVWKPVPSLGFS